jgi:hypothetical protein
VDRDWFRLRQGGAGHFVDKWHDGAQTDSTTIPSFPREIDGLIRDIGLGDRCNGFGYVPNLTDPQFHYVNEAHPMQREATDFTSRHGYFWTTLAPDVLTDDSQFSSAEAAIKSMTPMYRVGVSVDGEVTVIRVRTTPEGPSVYDRGNSTLDATITGSDWDLPSKIWGGPFRYVPGGICDGPNYYGHMLREADGSPRGFPVVGSLWPDMLRNRVWWWQ